VRDAKRIGEHLRGLEVAPELVLCSSAARARETFELVRSALAGVPVQLEDGLYGASSEALLARLRAVPDAVGCVLLLGHNPGLQELALALAARGTDLERVEAKFPTAALATLAVPPWSELGLERRRALGLRHSQATPLSRCRRSGLSRTPWPVAIPTEPAARHAGPIATPRIAADVAVPKEGDTR
jgi:phosphohistidine phosphatase SixA